jgi:tRNA modification GTPase
VLALVSAGSREERRAATALVSGGLDERTRALRDALADVRAMCEASLDFDESDTGHVPREELLALGERAREALDVARRFEAGRVRTLGLPRVVLRGLPNAGKSSLFNVMLGAERALVGERAGTTRDVLRAPWRVRGRDVLLCDTAGSDPLARGLDASAQGRAQRESEAADLVLLVVDAGRTHLPLEAVGAESETADPGATLLVWNKVDLPHATARPPAALFARYPTWVAVSAVTGSGLDELAAATGALLEVHRTATGLGRELAAAHRIALDGASSALESALTDLARGLSLDLVAEGLRASSAALDRIDGRTTPEDILDRVFARFCIGK